MGISVRATVAMISNSGLLRKAGAARASSFATWFSSSRNVVQALSRNVVHAERAEGRPEARKAESGRGATTGSMPTPTSLLLELWMERSGAREHASRPGARVQIPRLAALARDDHPVIPSAVEGSAPVVIPSAVEGICTSVSPAIPPKSSQVSALSHTSALSARTTLRDGARLACWRPYELACTMTACWTIGAAGSSLTVCSAPCVRTFSAGCGLGRVDALDAVTASAHPGITSACRITANRSDDGQTRVPLAHRRKRGPISPSGR
jgi:hypothetical protein